MAIAAEGLPALTQLARERPRVAPVDDKAKPLDLPEVRLEVFLRLCEPFVRRITRERIELHRDAHAPERRRERSEETSKQHPEAPIREAVADEEERVLRER